MVRILSFFPAMVFMAAQPAYAQSGKQSNIAPQTRVEIMLDDIATKLAAAADAHWHKGEYNHNVNAAKMVIAARPDYVEMYANSGWLLWSMNRDAEAEALYKEGIQNNPNTYFMYDELAQFYLTRKKDFQSAAVYYAKAVTFKDAKPQTWNALARSYEKSGQMAKALEAWEKAASFPDNIAAQPNLRRVRNLMKTQGGT